jgi:HJR/Mrr/RecB family endonuclease
MVVTNRCFTRRAITLAKVNNAELWDRNRLAREILAIRAPTLPA